MTTLARVVLALGALTLSGGCSPATRPDPGKPRTAPSAEPVLPFNPFEEAAVGDWSTMTMRIGTKDHEIPGVALVTFRVTKVEGDLVTVDAATLLPTGARTTPTTNTFSKSAPPTFAAFGRANGPLVNAGVSDDWHDCPGRRFVGKKVCFETQNDTKPMKVQLLVHPGVKGMGLVFAVIEVGTGTATKWTDYELMGFGTANGTSWGRAESDLNKAESPDSDTRRATYRDGSLGLSMNPPRCVAVREGEAACPALFHALASDHSGPVEISIKVTGTVFSPRTIEARVQEECAAVGMPPAVVTALRVGDSEGQLFEFGSADRGFRPETLGHRYLYLAVATGERSLFVTCSAPTAAFGRYEATFRACLSSLRIGDSTDDAAPASANFVYDDPLYGYSIRVPSLGPDLVARFASAPVREVIFDQTEIGVAPPSPSRAAFREGALANLPRGDHRRASIVETTDTTVSGREAVRATWELVSDASPPEPTIEVTVLAILDATRTVIVSCSCRKDEFERRSAEFRACLESVALSK